VAKGPAADGDAAGQQGRRLGSEWPADRAGVAELSKSEKDRRRRSEKDKAEGGSSICVALRL
jgi:hypothetical protein